MLKDLFQVPDKVKKLVLGWLSHIVFLHFSNDVEHPEHQNQNGTRKQSKVKPTQPLCVRDMYGSKAQTFNPFVDYRPKRTY